MFHLFEMTKKGAKVVRRADNLKLVQLGALLRAKRGERSQEEIRKRLRCSQSMVHQLEAGSINLSNKSLEDIAAAYGIKKEEIVAALVREKYGVDPTRASLLNIPVLSLDDVADWEYSTNAEDLWIVTPSFVDQRQPKMRAAILQRLRSGTNVDFFVPAADVEQMGAFADYQHQLRFELKPDEFARLTPHKLTGEELRWVTSSFVLANPRSQRVEGYTILLRDEGGGNQSAFGFRMSEDEARKKARGVQYWLDDSESKGKQS